MKYILSLLFVFIAFSAFSPPRQELYSYLTVKEKEVWAMPVSYINGDRLRFVMTMWEELEKRDIGDSVKKVLIAQSAVESAWGQCRLSKEANNVYGIKGDGITVTTHEYIHGKKTYLQQRFRKFGSIGDCIDKRLSLMHLVKRYATAPDYWSVVGRVRDMLDKAINIRYHEKTIQDFRYKDTFDNIGFYPIHVAHADRVRIGDFRMNKLNNYNNLKLNAHDRTMGSMGERREAIADRHIQFRGRGRCLHSRERRLQKKKGDKSIVKRNMLYFC